MQPLIPSPQSITHWGKTRSLPSPLTVTGPSWVSVVVSALPNHAPFPAVLPLPDDAGVAAGSRAHVKVISQANSEILAPRVLPDASYRLEINESEILVACSEPAGLIAALRTLGNLSDAGETTCGIVEDAPRFRYRGVHLDVCRHFFSAGFVKRYIELIASLGFNVFHWHLTEDQGWRLQIPGRPRLVEIGAYRLEQNGVSYGGFYSADEIRDVVRHAGALGVLVLPEVELPGHAQAALASYPNLGCTGEAVPVWNEWGISPHVFCAGKDEVFRFLEDVFDTVVDLFPSRYVHIGGDECPKDHWKGCAACQQRMAAHGLSDEDELQSYFVSRAARMLEERGRVAVGWDEILEGGLPEGTTVMSWRGPDGGRTAASAGHDVIMTPLEHCYFNMSYASDDPESTAVSLESVWSFNPVEGLDSEAARHVLGGEACLWTEFIETEEQAEHMLMPRLVAMADVLWGRSAGRSLDDFLDRARVWLERNGDRWRSASLDATRRQPRPWLDSPSA